MGTDNGTPWIRQDAISSRGCGSTAEASRPCFCPECKQEMGPGEGEYPVCRACRLGLVDVAGERDMTGIRSR